MDILVQVLASGLTLGALYSVAAIGLSLVYGSLNMLNMAHGAILTLGGYICYAAISHAGLHPALALIVAALGCGLVGIFIYFCAALPLLRAENFETNIFIATIGIGSIIENLMLKAFGPYPIPQPLAMTGQIVIGKVHIPLQSISILAMAIALMAAIAFLLQRTSTGRAIRATSMNREAAQLMGVRVAWVYVQVLALSGALAAVSGILISSITTLTPIMGGDPMLKAFIVCVVAGLGNVFGAVVAAIALGLLEAATQYFLGVRWSFATLLMLVILVLIWRPYGLFGKQQVVRL
ncbi:MAG: branched-chain amino acid ABC transporter permease [Mesorhizobium sp.]|uniref:branched-chain amino acid ABC transporter permease n=1 Tax=Mesorhizobium sp. TaxID=1871066 RepID=UPI000FE47959|nr:branched-chain amino acid ABC transporter permease [Mesorhizobium sp.]RWI48930.1 MAG: branched-chain amino acid ABC transporter permease [Mesorhizobium sp.]